MSDNRTARYLWRVPVRPWDDDEDMRQRDMAAEAARSWARVKYPADSADVLWVNRGPVNLVVTLTLR